MIVDTSVVVAIVRAEPDARAFLHALGAAPSLTISAGSWLELQAVMTRSADEVIAATADRLLAMYAFEIASFTIEQATIARDGYSRFGRGSGHRARLNFGDCFAYALARATGEPLLFKGDDFVHTDIVPAIPPAA